MLQLLAALTVLDMYLYDTEMVAFACGFSRSLISCIHGLSLECGVAIELGQYSLSSEFFTV